VAPSLPTALSQGANVKQCLAVEVSAFVAFYRSDQNIDRADRLELEIDFSEGKQVQTFSRRCLQESGWRRGNLSETRGRSRDSATPCEGFGWLRWARSAKARPKTPSCG
jgi:hypothetical protein